MNEAVDAELAQLQADAEKEAEGRLAEIEAREKTYDEDLPAFAGDCLSIRPKEGETTLLRFNEDQLTAHEACEDQLRRTGKVRKIIVKARKVGASTYVGARFYHRTSRKRGRRAFMMAHLDETTEILFDMIDRFHRHNPHAPATGKDNANELSFPELDSSFGVGTAGSKHVGVGDTVHYFHGSEVARWPNAQVHATGALEAVPDIEGTEIILESVAEGASGLFYNYAMAALRKETQYEVIFLPWFTHSEYEAQPPEGWRPPPAFVEYAYLHKLGRRRIYWAYRKNADLAAADNLPVDTLCWRFKQQFPATVEEAFRASRTGRFISAEAVIKARKTTVGLQREEALIIGCDFAATGAISEGGDLNVFIDRRGRHAGGKVYERFLDKSPVSVANKLGAVIAKHKPDMCFLDTGGGGAAVYDILLKRNFGEVLALVDFGSQARDARKYVNKRAEMWGEMRDWLTQTGGVQIPDDDVLDSEITAPSGKERTLDQRVLIEPKATIRKELGRSPDGGDALALTFAEPVRKRQHFEGIGDGHGGGDPKVGY